MIEFILNFSLTIASIIFIFKRSLTYLHIFQQQEYNNSRFCSWFINTKAFDKRLTSILLFLFAIHYFCAPYLLTSGNYVVSLIGRYLAFIIVIFVFGFLEPNRKKSAKKKLAMTKRANRIYYLSIFLNIMCCVITLFNIQANSQFITLLLSIHLIPISIILANVLLAPIEKIIQQKFSQEAQQKLSKHKPLIIGITGSFGKTSVKHFLGHILSQTDHTLITSGSINTTMGISRTIRKELNNSHKYFIVEMGAYGIGSIKRICDLTPPDFAIITAIGAAHYERFKNLETVATAKFELATATINNSRIKKPKIVIPETVLNTAYAHKYLQDHRQHFTVIKQPQINNINQLKTGLSFDLIIANTTYHLETPIFGLHNATNISLACVAAYELGISMPTIINALKTMPQINHRLEVLQQGDCTIIDDAYNANPEGFNSAVELLNFLCEPTGRRILVTPGLIELGDKHNSEHMTLGKTAAKYTDIAIVVNPKRIKSFVDGFTNNITNANQQLIRVASFKEAQEWLKVNGKPKDTILFANDLPDLYESTLAI